MEYEKKYNSALDAAKHIYDDMKSGGNFGGMEDLEVIFPELRESEDERIRKHLVEIVELYWGKTNDPDKAKDLAYLEKQKEQKKINKTMCIDKLYDKIIRNSKEAERQYLSMATKTIVSKAKKLKESPLTDEAFKEQLERVLRNNVLDTDIRITGDTVVGAKINPKEQKPIEYLDKDKVYAIMTKLTILSYSQLIPINSDEYKQIYEITHDVRSLLDYPIKQKPVMIQWTGKNLKEVIDFTGKSPRFDEWFKSWEEFEDYVHSHDDILKLFCEDGSHYEVPVGAWIVKTPDGYNIPSRFRFIQKPAEWSEEDERNRDRAVFYTRYYQRTNSITDGSEECIDWLKSLHPSWKPSEEQMEVLQTAERLVRANNYPENAKILAELYEQLKAL